MRLITCGLILVTVLFVSAEKINVLHEWKFVEFEWPSELEKNNAIKSKKYDPTSVIPMDVDRDQAGRVFVSFPRIRGVPATLGTVTNITGQWGPLIKPYPDWSWFQFNHCNTLQNVYRIEIDKCNRLWVLDTGYKGWWSKTSYCPQKLVVFDLNTDKHIRTIEIPNHIARDKNGDSLLSTPVVETEGPRCENTTVYIANAIGKLIVFNGKNIWALNHTTFEFDPKATVITTGVHNITWEAGILGLAISPQVYPDEPKYLYYRPLNSFGLFAAETNELRRSFQGNSVNYFGANNVLSSQAVAMAFSSQGTLFFGLTKENAIGCYNRYRELNKSNIGIVAQDYERLNYLNGVKVIRSSTANLQEELLVISNQLLASQTDSNFFSQENTVKFRVLSSAVQDLIENTICNAP